MFFYFRYNTATWKVCSPLCSFFHLLNLKTLRKLFLPVCLLSERSSSQPQPPQVFCSCGGRKRSCVDSGWERIPEKEGTEISQVQASSTLPYRCWDVSLQFLWSKPSSVLSFNITCLFRDCPLKWFTSYSHYSPKDWDQQNHFIPLAPEVQSTPRHQQTDWMCFAYSPKKWSRKLQNHEKKKVHFLSVLWFIFQDLKAWHFISPATF